MEEQLIPNKDLPRVAATGPIMVKVEAGKVYSWCTCGLSQKQPFCDNAHRQITPMINADGESVMPYRSLKVQFDESKEVWFCQCKHTKNPPFCDGTHHSVKKD